MSGYIMQNPYLAICLEAGTLVINISIYQLRKLRHRRG